MYKAVSRHDRKRFGYDTVRKGRYMRLKAYSLILISICMLTSCEHNKDSKSIMASPSPAPTTTSTAKQLTKLSIDQAIDLAIKRLDISNNNLKYIATDPKNGFYEVEVNHLKYYINPENGDYIDEYNDKIINLLGKKDKIKAEISSDISIEEMVIENIKNNVYPNNYNEEVKYSAQRNIPYFNSSEQETEGGLIIDNTYIKLSDLGISKYIDNSLRHYYFTDVDNDGIDEICCYGLSGTGLYPFTQYFKFNKETSKYSEWNPDIPDYIESEMDYYDIQFFENKDKTYMVLYDDQQFMIYYIHDNKLESVSRIDITYPSYEVDAKSKDDALRHLKDKYTKKITFFDENIPNEYVLKKADKIYPMMERSARKKFMGRTYTITDINNDGEEELFFKWELGSETKLNSTLYGIGYAIFKQKNNKYKLYDTNEDGNSKYIIYYENQGSTYNKNIFFEKYHGKVYTIIINSAYFDNLDFDIRKKDILKVYRIDKNEMKEIGAINVVWKPKIVITPLKK